ncbi:DNA alkylation repair protein [Allorhizocola rhizosphaerae]|uniref:DNA alkylation repair protein n=1 Tax=Allorhizocola rhizosphaerae TaxID=1872709 RepID=UPI000E3E828E|nr:DNA alkylation repair protein [Allorhizocola rhizosphaerae]
MSAEKHSAEEFVKRLEAMTSPTERATIRRYFEFGKDGGGEADFAIGGFRMGDIFNLAKEFVDMPLDDIDKLLASPIHELRVGALSIMGKQFTWKKTTAQRRKELYDLYMRRTDRVNTWDLVDLSGHHVVGGYLLDKPRDPLYKLARSKRWWERRLAMFATLHFVRKGDLDDTFELAEILVNDQHDLVQKVVGGMLREAGKTDRGRLKAFLDKHAGTMPRVALRYAIEHLEAKQRKHYLELKQASA